MGEKMKLSKHQKQIVDALIKGTVYDIPSYLKEFQKWHLRKYDLTRPLAKFTEEEGGNQYKVIIDEDKAYIKGTTPMNMGIGTINVDTKFLRKPEDIPDDAWEYREAELIRNIKPIEIEHKGETFSFDFMEAGVNVADNFDDIIEFMSLWAYLRQESLILEVPRDVTADDLGILFELKHREPKPETPFVIHRNKAPDSPVKPITRVLTAVTEFYDYPPTFLISSYMDEVWELNSEHQKNCEEYIGRKILPTEKLRIFAQQLYTTSGEWQFRIPLVISIIALIVSFLPIIQSLLPSNEPDYLAQISQQIEVIETLVESDQVAIGKLEVIISTLESVSASLDEMSANQQSVEINNLTAQIKQLNEWLSERQDLVPPNE